MCELARHGTAGAWHGMCELAGRDMWVRGTTTYGRERRGHQRWLMWLYTKGWGDGTHIHI